MKVLVTGSAGFVGRHLIKHLEDHGEVCPANWTKGAKAMNATHDGVADYLSSN